MNLVLGHLNLEVHLSMETEEVENLLMCEAGEDQSMEMGEVECQEICYVLPMVTEEVGCL